jgi:MFS family permease
MATAEKKSYSLAAYGRLLRDNRNFRLLWIAQVISELGDWLYSVALYSLLLDLTGSGKSVGLALVFQLMPQVFVAPLAGVINDRLSRRTVMILADIGRFFVVLAMVFVQSASLVWVIYVLLFFETVMWALFEPGRSAILPNITRNQSELLVANALGSTTWSVNLAVGSAVGGLIAVAFGRNAVFVLNAVSFLVSAAFLRAMRIEEPHAAQAPPMRVRDLVDYSPVWEGVEYVRRDPRLIATMLVKAGMGLLGAHWVILPIFGERVFPVGAATLGDSRAGMLGMSLLMGSRGVGALLGSFLSGYWSRNEAPRMRTGIAAGFALVSVSYVALSGAPTLGLACLAVIAAHTGTSMTWVFSTTMLQTMTEDRFRGRVFSADFAGLFLLMSLVSLVAGNLVDWGVHVRTVALATGILGLLPFTLWLLALRLWRR